MAQDPLRQVMSMADDLRRNVDSMITQGTRQVKSALPQLPFPGAGNGVPELPKGPQELLAKLPKLPELAGGLPELPGAAEAKRAAAARPTSKFGLAGPQLEVHPKEWHNSHTLSPGEIIALKGRLQKNGVPTSALAPKVLSK